MKRYNNYHKHTHISNLFGGADSNTKPEEYIKKCVEYGHTNYFTTEHGSFGDIFEARTLCNQYGLRCIAGIEGYIVPNPLEKDKRNYHIIVIPKTDDARKQMNYVSSHANDDGFYYKPRFFMEDLLALDKDSVYLSTACVTGLMKDEDSIIEILIPLIEHFGENVLLEVQNHIHTSQIKINKKALKFQDKYGLKLIAANDSHYVDEQGKNERLKLLKGKDITYNDEDTFTLDFPTAEVMFDRFKKQGVLSEDQIEEAINNTLLFDKCEEIQLDTSIKMPTIYPELTPEERLQKLKKIVTKRFSHIAKEENITGEELEKYKDGIRYEMDIIDKTNEEIHMADYFLLNTKLVDLAVNKYGGVLTRGGRGCHTEDSLVWTLEGLKKINEVTKNDKVLTSDGMFRQVIETYKYDINEDTITYEYAKQGSIKKKYHQTATTDHKILVRRNGINEYLPLCELKIGDLLCSPKIKNVVEKYLPEKIDLQEYNIFGYEYDDDYIYEKVSANQKYMYSPRELQKKTGISESFFRNMALSTKTEEDYSQSRNPRTIKAYNVFKQNCPMSLNNYRKYVRKHSYVTMKIKRYLPMNELTNLVIGMLYGDGWTLKDYGVSLAVTKTNTKKFNKIAFELFCSKMNFNCYYNEAKDRDLVQITAHSRVFNNFVSENLFKSKKGIIKIFNTKLYNQNNEKLYWLYMGLQKTDGSFDRKEGRICFDNISLSLISAYKYLISVLFQVEPSTLNVRLEHTDDRGYHSRESYKIRWRKKKCERYLLESDDKYYYLPVTNLILNKMQKVKVYDICVQDVHNYVLNNVVVHNSCASFYINRILGMTQLDRFKINLPIFPDRFISVARCLQNRSLADIDMNVMEQEPFVKASRELLGEHGCYPMYAPNTMQLSEAFRNVCRSKKLKYETYNEVAKDIEKYIDDKDWKPIIEEANRYVGTIVAGSVHPCAHALLSADIRYEYGVYRFGDFLCVLMTSAEADEYKFLKNDYLIVSVWKLIYETFKEVGIPIIPAKQLLAEIKDDQRIWDLFKNGLTCTLNQVDSDNGMQQAKRYGISSFEQGAFLAAAIRPSFDSWREKFLNHEDYSTGSKDLDKVLESTDHYILFQENLMQYFEWLGVTPAESIGLIKKISKKKIKQEDFDKLEERLKEEWIVKTGSEDMFAETWEMIQSCISYGFASPHAAATSLDMCYGAYLKVHYPVQYYTVCFNNYNGDQVRTRKLTNELPYFGIKLRNIKFRFSKGEYEYDLDSKTIYKGIGSIKFISNSVADELYALRNKEYGSFIDLLIEIKSNTSLNSKQLTILISVDFFSEFGEINALLEQVKQFDAVYGKKQFKKDKLSELGVPEFLVAKYAKSETAKMFKDIDTVALLKDWIGRTEYPKTTVLDKLRLEGEYLGYCVTTSSKATKDTYFVTGTAGYSNNVLTLYNVKTGETKTEKYSKGKREPIKKGYLIRVTGELSRQKYIKTGVDDKGNPIFGRSEEREVIIETYDILKAT